MAGVILDAGHGGYDAGAQYNGRKEKDDNLRLALAVGEILSQNGIPVIQDRVIFISRRHKKQELEMKVGQIILFLSIEMQVRMQINIME